MKALIAVGTGRYADPWHRFADNARRVAGILSSDGWLVELDEDVDRAMTRLDDVDLLVVSAGDPWGKGERSFSAPQTSVTGLADAVARGIGVIGLHAAAASLRDYPSWGETLGGIWVPEASTHPEISESKVSVCAHPLTAGIGEFSIFDEMYSDLQPIGDRTTLATHTWDGRTHPLVWLREKGAARVAYDALGHDLASYDSPEHVVLLRRLARWAAKT
ncbi:MAG TPA: ThuA domain-containing protein [Cellulomonas sp.]